MMYNSMILFHNSMMYNCAALSARHVHIYYNLFYKRIVTGCDNSDDTLDLVLQHRRRLTNYDMIFNKSISEEWVQFVFIEADVAAWDEVSLHQHRCHSLNQYFKHVSTSSTITFNSRTIITLVKYAFRGFVVFHGLCLKNKYVCAINS